MLAKHYKKTILLILSLLLLAGAAFSIIHFWPHPPTLETTLKNSGQAGEEINKNFSSEEQLAIQKTNNGFEVKDDLNLKFNFPQTYTSNITATLPGGKEIKIIDRNAKDISGKLLSSQKEKKDNDIVEYKLDNRKTIYYSYQKDGSGTRKIKNWILYQNGNGNEKESYQFQNAKITLDKVGNANVSYNDERSNSNPTPSTATLRIPKPFYIDKDGKRTDLDWKLDQKSNTLSIEWSLNKDQYPIALDPTMVFRPSSANAAYEAQAANNTSTTISDYETTSFTAGNYTSVGTDDTDYATTTASRPTYVDDVFSTYLYAGNGTKQTINNGITLASENGFLINNLHDSADAANLSLGKIASGNGNVYASGSYGDTPFIAKYGADGTLAWKRALPTGEGDVIGLYFTSSNYLLVAARKNNITSVRKITEAGVVVYSKNVTHTVSTGAVTIQEAVFDNSENVAFVGTISMGGNYGNQAYISMFDANSNFLWGSSIGTDSGYETVLYTAALSGSTLYVGGNQKPDASSATSGFIAAYTYAGAQSWKRNFYAGSTTQVRSLVSAGGTLFAGLYDTSQNLSSVVSLDASSGMSNWEKFHAQGNASAASLYWDGTYLYVGSTYYADRYKILLSKFNSSGVAQWSKVLYAKTYNDSIVFSDNCITGISDKIYLQAKANTISALDDVFVLNYNKDGVATGDYGGIEITNTTPSSGNQGYSNTGVTTNSYTNVTSSMEDASAAALTDAGLTASQAKKDDIVGKGGMVWIKNRSAAYNNVLMSTAQGNDKLMSSNGTSAQATLANFWSSSASGFTLGSGDNYNNGSGYNYASWTFRKAPKFFDVVTYTGTGITKTISHSLGITPGMIIVRRTDSAGGWAVYHKSVVNASVPSDPPEKCQLMLNTTDAVAQSPYWNNTAPTETEFTVKGGEVPNINGATYVAYLFADDSSADGLIRCGSFNTDGSGNATVNLGWEPQWVLMKSTGASQDWITADFMRGFTTDGINAYLFPNTAGAESSTLYNSITSTGFKAQGATLANQTYIYCAIRRPNKPPTSGSGVFSATTYSGSGTSGKSVSYPLSLVDLLITGPENTGSSSNNYKWWDDRLRGPISKDATTGQIGLWLDSTSTSTENSSQNASLWGMNNLGIRETNVLWNSGSFISYAFRRAPGVFDTVAYTGDDVAGRTVNHSLGVVPELMIIKSRDLDRDWRVYHSALGNTKNIRLNSNSVSQTDSTVWNNTSPTESVFTLGGDSNVNSVSHKYVAYLFATKPGISKVGSYTGNGSSQTINAGFTGGAKYVLVKETNNVGDWYVWDSTRGIVAGNDPHISLNARTAEVAIDDSVDPDNSGFIVNQNATTNINDNGASYIYLAFSGDTIAAPADDKYATQLYTFNLPDMTNISKLQVDLTAYATASAGNGIVAKIWNNNTNDWETLTDLGNTDSSMPGTVSTQELTTNPSYYLDGNNQSKILVSSINPSDTSASAVLNVDYVNLTSISSAITTDTNDAYEATPTSTTSTTLSDYQTTALDAGDYAKVTAKDADYVSSSASSPQYVDDVFSTYLYTGNSSTQTINNGIDLAGEGGLVWLKRRDSTSNNGFYDTVRGVTNVIYSDLTNASSSLANSLTAFNSNGFSMGSNSTYNWSAALYSSWTFRKAPKFFDVVTYTGDGTDNRQIDHSLGISPGMIIVKRTDSSGYDWIVGHRSANATNPWNWRLLLNTTGAASDTGATGYFPSEPTSTNFTIDGSGGNAWINASGATYVAYLFANDESAEGLIRCGSYTGTGASPGPRIELGWEPQWILYKVASTTGGWGIHDFMRGLGVGTSSTSGSGNRLYANTSDAESGLSNFANVDATGFTITPTVSDINGNGQTYIYCAIRRPNKPPTSGTGVYNAIARTGTGTNNLKVNSVGFSPDLIMLSQRYWNASPYGHMPLDRLRGAFNRLYTNTTGVESNGSPNYSVKTFDMSGYTQGDNDGSMWDSSSNGMTFVDHFFRRAPGVFDEVAYTGTGSAHTVNHNLGVVPEMMIIKTRNAANNWAVYHASLGATKYARLNLTDVAGTSATFWNNTAPDSSVFTVRDEGEVNQTGKTIIAYLFATKPGISKVGSYTGNGSSQTIDAGFTGGAKYILIKRTDNTGDWYVWDSTRGIVAGNDPHLSLNTTAAEVTGDDSVDPDNSGFIVNQNATTNINVNGGTYIYLAFSGDTIAAPATDKYATQLYSFDLSNITDITKLRVTMNAYATASAGNGVTAKIWNNHTNDWEILNTLTNTASSMPTTASKQDISTNVDYYLDNDNKVKILLSSTNPSITGTDATIYTDLISVSSLTTPIVSTIDPVTTPNTNQTIDISLTGQNFASGATVTFKRTNQPDIPCKNVSVTSATALTCSANLRGANAGAWDITVTNIDQMEGTLSGAMTVTEGPHAPFTTTGTVKLRGSVRMERTGERTSP